LFSPDSGRVVEANPTKYYSSLYTLKYYSSLYTLDIFSTQYCDKKTKRYFEPWVSKMNEGKLLTKLNLRHVRVFRAYLGWALNSMPQKYQCLFLFLSKY